MTRDAATLRYEAPRIEKRASIELPLVGFGSGSPVESAAFRVL